MASNNARIRYARKHEEVELRKAFDQIDFKRDDMIDAEELEQLFDMMGHKPPGVKQVVADIIWEADEDCDGKNTYEEFCKMYQRCQNDTAGNEPSQLYHITLFLMNQKDNVVSMESALQLMYLMHGKQDLDRHLQEIFGTSDLNSGVTLNLTNFLKSFHTAQVRKLNNKITSRTYKVPPPAKK
mmetsp:Transcript_21112/g.54123  ORF Transcript_21112/g.54123 Transcript_21112/m.54123 type:complete len:183 (-) Transcript_21112:87-635(-)|eukprot:jgi/Tetstr1/462785/TSEL_007736.t1